MEDHLVESEAILAEPKIVTTFRGLERSPVTGPCTRRKALPTVTLSLHIG